jgi:uncharacterized protein
MNRLANESSPYLLQHAGNPVDWYAWGEEALAKAKAENKPIILSIGYSACHWCHVMEHESFEHEQVAAIMNQYFISIKVDREERPDVDAVYMEALQAMGTRGGWPLNVFLLPDAKPFYGVTYLPQKNWVQLLQSIQEAFTKHYDQLASSAEGFVASMLHSEVEKYGLAPQPKQFTKAKLGEMFQKISEHFDRADGGMDRAPKFPMPSIYKFLLRYYDASLNPDALQHIEHTLTRIALGGIYDHVGGGWARYSVDGQWFIPHFEKMLYDNAQLLTIFAEAFMLTKNPLFADRVKETIGWLTREMRNGDGAFYSALDADSEGIEGKFYIWTDTELQEMLAKDYGWFAKLYNIQHKGNWEHGYNHLHLTETVEKAARRAGIFSEAFSDKYKATLKQLFEQRKTRVRPGLDDKILASWNGLLVTGLVNSYRAMGDESFKALAIQAGEFIRSRMTWDNHRLWHNFKNGKASITGFLEDYASVIEAYLSLYQVTFDESWLSSAKGLCDYTITHFYDAKDGFFYFTDDSGEALIARKKELFDNVIPASNSIMATNLYALGKILDNVEYLEYSDHMLSAMQQVMVSDTQWVTNWAALFCQRVNPTAEVVIVGEDADEIRRDMDRFFIPNKVLLGTKTYSELSLLKHKTDFNGKTAIYVCYDKICQLPVTEVEAALEQLNSLS